MTIVSYNSFKVHFNPLVQQQLNDHDDKIRKLLQEIKLIKLQSKAMPAITAPTALDLASGSDEQAPVAMAGPDLSDLFDALNSLGDDLRQEMNDKFALKKDFKDYKATTDDELSGIKRRLDNLEKMDNNLEKKLANLSQDTKKDL